MLKRVERCNLPPWLMLFICIFNLASHNTSMATHTFILIKDKSFSHYGLPVFLFVCINFSIVVYYWWMGTIHSLRFSINCVRQSVYTKLFPLQQEYHKKPHQNPSPSPCLLITGWAHHPHLTTNHYNRQHILFLN